MKPAYQKDDALIQDIERARNYAPSDLHVWWLGQSGFLVAFDGKTGLFDPYLSDSLTRKYAATDKPHTRITEQVVNPVKLRGIDVVTSSHNHTDHLDRETLDAIFLSNPSCAFVIPEANREFVAERLRCDPTMPVGINDGVAKEVAGVRFHGIAAAHDKLKTNDKGEQRYMGFVVELGHWTLYHSGDTRLYNGLSDRLRRFKIDVAFLPINGHKPERRVAGNLNAEEAAELAAGCGFVTSIPHHYDLFEFNTADPKDFTQACKRRRVGYRILRNGQRATFTK